MSRKSLFSTLALASTLSLSAGYAVAQLTDYEPVTDDILQNPDPEDWLHWRRTLNSWGYSPLDEINHDNVGNLELLGPLK